MRLCRFEHAGQIQAGLYDEKHIVPIDRAAQAFAQATGETLTLGAGDDLRRLLPPDGTHFATAQRLAEWLADQGDALPESVSLTTAEVQLLVPNPRPAKLFLLAGNYAAHIEEGGGMAAERAETIPYVFMKPPTTTLTDPGRPVKIPAVSPKTIDWELELAVVVGRRCKGVSEAEALSYVAGYTVINDISNRKFRPNPGRKERPKDQFFDWLHGKWFDSFCPCGPCITSAESVADPQRLGMRLSVNGRVMQDASTALQIFPVAAVIEFISSFVTLEPGDMISTGTPSGVGNTTGTYLAPGDRIEAHIDQIGTLISPVEAE